jgi:hypothetical protein
MPSIRMPPKRPRRQGSRVSRGRALGTVGNRGCRHVALASPRNARGAASPSCCSTRDSGAAAARAEPTTGTSSSSSSAGSSASLPRRSAGELAARASERHRGGYGPRAYSSRGG